MKNEIWKPVKGYEGLYEVSDLGRVKRLSRKARNTLKSYRILPESILSPCDNGRGYMNLSLYKDKQAKHLYIHRLVAVAFIPSQKGRPHVNHKNGIKSDNRVENLEWCSMKENNSHALQHRLKKTKLTDRQVKAIYSQYKKGIPIQKIADLFNIHNTHVSRIAGGKSYQHLNLTPLRRLKRKSK